MICIAKIVGSERLNTVIENNIKFWMIFEHNCFQNNKQTD